MLLQVENKWNESHADVQWFLDRHTSSSFPFPLLFIIISIKRKEGNKDDRIEKTNSRIEWVVYKYLKL